MDTRVDAVIVGAGPAGGMAAGSLAQGGFRVALLERQAQVGLPIQCGEGLSAAALELNGLSESSEWICQTVRGAKLHFPGGPWCFITQERGYSAYRDRFDRWIVDRAVDAGAELRLETTFEGMARRRDGWRIKTNRGPLTTRLVIGADGPRSVVAEAMGWVKRRRWLNALEYRFPREALEDGDGQYLHLHASAGFAGGYGWVFPRGEECSVGVCSPLPLRRLLTRFCGDVGVEPRRAEAVVGGLIPHHVEFTRLAGSGVALAGDAAGATNPISGGGIHSALYSGRLAGEWALRALRADDSSLLEGYDKALRSSPYLDPVIWEAAEALARVSDDWLAYIGRRLDGQSLAEVSRKTLLATLVRRPSALPRLGLYLRFWKGLLLTVSYGW